MSEISFSGKAASYAQTALVQKSAAEVLLNLVQIKKGEDVLDLGCGPGNVTQKIALLTDGTIYGTDVSEGMIAEAFKSNQLFNVHFAVKDAEELGYSEKFDVIYCNSAFQWFSNPPKVLQQCLRALKPGGRMGIQAPATLSYCPNFVAAIDKISTHPTTGEIFHTFQSPWLFLDDADTYKDLFEQNGIKVSHAEIVVDKGRYMEEQIYKIFQSGAENGYLNQSYYTVPIDDNYIAQFRSLVRETINEQADEKGIVELVFNRIYLLAHKE